MRIGYENAAFDFCRYAQFPVLRSTKSVEKDESVTGDLHRASALLKHSTRYSQHAQLHSIIPRCLLVLEPKAAFPSLVAVGPDDVERDAAQQ